MQKNSICYLLSIVLLVCIACDSESVFDAYKSIPSTWNKNQKISFKLQAPDTVKPYNIFINLRNNDQYMYSNLFLIATISYPHGKTIQDTLEYRMANPSGEFLGTGFSSIKENKLWYKENFQFNEKGTYIVTLQQAMRENGQAKGITELKGITDVGIRVEHIPNSK